MTVFSYKRVILLVCFSLFTGCTYIANLFPDKQKQYRYHTETPPLEVPPDLTSTNIQGAVTPQGKPTGINFDEPEQPGYPAEEASQTSRLRSRSTYSRHASAIQPGSDEIEQLPTRTTLAQNVSDVPLIEVESSYEETWVALVRALGRMRVEVIDQNESDGVIHVYYAGAQTEHAPEDAGFFQSLFNHGLGRERNSSEFRVRLERLSENIVQVFITDQEGNPQTSGLGLELLQGLNEKLQSPNKK